MRAVRGRFRLPVPGRTPRSAASPGLPPPPAAAAGREGGADRGRAEPFRSRRRPPDRYVKRPPRPRGAGAAILDAGVSAGRRVPVAILSRRGGGQEGGCGRGTVRCRRGAWTEPRQPPGRAGGREKAAAGGAAARGGGTGDRGGRWQPPPPPPGRDVTGATSCPGCRTGRGGRPGRAGGGGGAAGRRRKRRARSGLGATPGWPSRAGEGGAGCDCACTGARWPCAKLAG